MQRSAVSGRIGVLVVAAAGFAFALVAYRVQIHNLFEFTSPERASATVVAGCAFIVAGLVAWLRQPANRMGVLMTATGFALLARQFRYSHDKFAFTVFFLAGELCYALVAHAVLAYPSGIVRDRIERTFVKVAYATALVFPALILLFYDGSKRLRYFDKVPRDNAVLVHGNGELAHVLQDVYAVIAYGVLASLFILLILRRLGRATPRARKLLAPLLVAAVVIALRAVFDGIVTFASPVPPSFVSDNVFWWQVAALTALPLALLAGLLRARLAQATVADLARQLEHTPPNEFGGALARALHDPSLQVAFWLPEREEYVDADGLPVTLPAEDRRHAVTTLDQDGAPVAAIIHDPALLDEPDLVESALAAARLALENARLHAEVRARLAEVHESRRRILEAADAERVRIERDLHDGAQQSLTRAALDLRSALHGRDVDPQLERLLVDVASQLQGAARELRDYVHGVYPSVLTEAGLAAAIESLADQHAVTVSIAELPERRLPQSVEAAAYFVACEALTNAEKHSSASLVTISAQRRDGTLRVEVVDDGVGGADPGGGGLRGLADRVEALGGRLGVESRPQAGTTVWAEIPSS